MAKKKNNGKLTKADIRNIRTALLLKRAEILGDVISMEDEALRRDTNNSSHMPIHLADIGSDNYQMEHTLNLVGSERRLLSEINDALSRIDKGVYGKCQGDGHLIPKARLKAIPWARFCINCAALSEKRYVAAYNGPKGQDFSYAVDIESDDDVKKNSSRSRQVIKEDLLGETD